MKPLFALFLIFSLQALAFDWDYSTLEDCSSYDVESFNTDTDFSIKCIDHQGEVSYLEDYLFN